jgi:polar amino acid transport system substrate-binding protein
MHVSRPSGIALVLVGVLMAGAACSSSNTKSGAATTTTAVSASTLPAKYASNLNVAMDATYPPDEFVQNGKIVGWDVDLVNAIASQLGTKATDINVTFDGIIPGMLSGKYDVGASSFTDTKAREQQLDFVTYFSSGEGYYENANSTGQFNGLASLCGHTVSVEAGTTEESDAKAQAGKCKVTVDSFNDQNQANLAVSTGRADVGFADSQVAGNIVEKSNGQFKLVGTPFSTAPYGFALPKNSGLAPLFLSALEKLIANGTYTQILTKWGVQAGAITNPVINGATS